MKYIFWIFLFLLPFHALFVTTLECKYGVDANILRFWKEIFIGLFLVSTFIKVAIQNEFSLKRIYTNNNFIGLSTAFILCSFVYIFFPYFQIKPSSLLWFRYDVFFIFAMIIWYYSDALKKNIDFLLKSIFIWTFIVLIIFLPWYLSWNISSTTEFFWYSDKVSTYSVDQCLSFSQNVDGHHRFQATFGWPIRFSVYLVVVYLLYLWFILMKDIKNKYCKYAAIAIPSLLVFISIFYSYSKTSFLWLIAWILLFAYLTHKFKFHKTIQKKYILWFTGWVLWLFTLIVILKKDLFLHIGAMLNRLENLSKSVEMFFYNPIWYGLGIAGPASQIGKSIESAGGWQISTSSIYSVNKFLPENWYVQILLEQWIIWFSLFIALVSIIWIYLYEIIKQKKDFLSIGIFSAYISLVFMWLFTHSFEESATSYSLFLLIWAYIWLNLKHTFKN